MTDWHFGPLGWMSRYRGIATWIGGNLSAGTVLDALVTRPEILWGFSGIGISGGLTLWWMRRFLLRHSKSNIRFHEFSHSIRDLVANILSSKAPIEGVARVCEVAAQQIALFFREFKEDPNITCTIRVASVSPDGDGSSPAQRHYVTLGRSDLLDPSRKTHSIPIIENQGLISVVLENGQQGAILVPSIPEAIKEGSYMRTQNDGLPDYVSLAICPINTI